MPARSSLPVGVLDKRRAFRNPWGLTKCQCYTLRVICANGGTKRAAYVEGIDERLLEHHLMKARKVFSMFGNDVRLYLYWDRWTRKDEGTDDEGSSNE